MISFTVPALLIALGVTHAIQDSARSRPARQDSETAPKKSKKSNKRPGKKRIGGFLGLHISDARLDGKTFVQIDSVVKGSDAEKLGFKAGDRILRINRRRIRNGDAFIMNLWGTAGLLRSRRGGTSRGGVVPPQNKIFIQRGDKEIVLEGGFDELDKTPGVGQKAPDFTLESADGKTAHTLSKMIGEKPIVLIFGSWT